MEYDEERAREKRAEVAAVAATGIRRHWEAVGLPSDDTEAESVARAVVAAFVRVIPPEKAPLISEYITISSGGRQGGRSRKPGNLLLNMRVFFSTLSKAALGANAVAVAPWTAPLAALVIWDSIWAGVSVDPSERDATVMWTLWSARDGNNCVPHATLLKSVNAEFAKYGRPPLAVTELVASLDRLQKLKAIERWKKDPEKWWLREWVSADYQ